MGIPLISVLMPVFNCHATLEEAAGCVLGQTLGDFELIIINDGSADNSLAVAESLARRDPRVRVVSQENRGVGAALNHGLELARGKLISRMDADDRTPLTRFAEEVEYLDRHPEVTVVGGWHRTFAEGDSTAGFTPKTFEFPTESGHLRAVLMFRNPVSHPTVMMRGDVFRKNGWRYSTERRFPEDYELWVTIAEKHLIVNLPRVYLEYRIWPGSVCQQRWEGWEDHQVGLQCRLLARVGLVPDASEREIHKALSFDQIAADADFLRAAHRWLQKILEYNRRMGAKAYFAEAGLMRALTGRYIALLKRAAEVGEGIYAELMPSPFRANVEIDLPLPRQDQ